jgi:hypothetical protein
MNVFCVALHSINNKSAMMSKAVYVILVSIRLSFLVLVCFNLHSCHAIAVENQLLKIIQNFDETYEKGVSSSGSHLSSFRSSQREGDLIIDEEWTHTQSKHQKAILKTARFVPQRNGDEGMPFHRDVFLLDQKRTAKKAMYLAAEVPFQEYATSQDVRYAILDLYAPDSTVFSFQFDLFLLAMGRGIANEIGSLDAMHESVEWNGEKCVLIMGQCKGRIFGEPGTWKVYVLPKAAYMVRHAQFLFNDDVYFEVETFGLNRKNDCFYPEKSDIRILNVFNTKHRFDFSDVRLEFDSELFERVTRDIDGELPKSSIKVDGTSGERKAQVIGGRESHESYELTPRPFFSGRNIFLIVFNLVGILLLSYLYYRSRWKE